MEWPTSLRMKTLSPSEADGMRPSEPGRTEAASLRMSPNIFSVTTTSKNDGFLITYHTYTRTHKHIYTHTNMTYKHTRFIYIHLAIHAFMHITGARDVAADGVKHSVNEQRASDRFATPA